ncbi:hypothetical protein AB0918_07560 [Streptomyces sp. NPDC006864]|uniref:hypothetical protein n=1 Tax=Streptomyces sp. NPDC006864 TaxID=3154780 RepID=UPI003456DDF8
MWSLLATTSAALALGLLPDLVQAVPGVGSSLYWMGAVAVVAVLLVAWATHALRTREGVGIVIYLGAGSHWDRTRLREMQDDALRRHAACFVVEPDALLGGVRVSDRVAFAYRVMQARLEEESAGDRGAPESVSFYVTARHADAFRFGGLLRAQLHDNVSVFAEPPAGRPSPGGPEGTPGARPGARRRVVARLMGQSEERGRASFPALRLDSALKRPPDAGDVRCLREVLEDPEAGPVWHAFSGAAGGSGPGRIALIVAVADNPGLVGDALLAAERGESDVYAFPDGAGQQGRPAGEGRRRGPSRPGGPGHRRQAGGADGTGEEAGRGDPAANRCAGALVVRTRPGNVPDTAEHHEALVRYVVHHWRRAVEEQGAEGTCWLFTDGPAAFVLALGALVGRRTMLVPLAERRRTAMPPSAPAPPSAPVPVPAPAPAPVPAPVRPQRRPRTQVRIRAPRLRSAGGRRLPPPGASS